MITEKTKMEYTVADLLREKELGSWLCLTEGMDLSSIAIKSCFPHELPMQGFIRPGELVVTTVSEGRQDPADQRGCREDPWRNSFIGSSAYPFVF